MSASIVVLLALLLLDTGQTAYAIAAYGLGKEANPFARTLFALPGGFVALVVLRLLSLAGIAGLVRRYPCLSWTLLFCIGVLAVTVVNNFIALSER